MNSKLIDFTIGADPEFSCEYRNRLVSASDYVGGDSHLDFGRDGNAVTFELRPAPSKNPLQIVHNIRGIFMRQVMREPKFLKFKWVSGSFHLNYPLGGHVHFGLTNQQVDHYDAINILDHYVGVCSLLLEKRSDAIRRRQDSYGHMGDMRVQDWGFEYRPMSSWISTPYVAAAMLCLSKAVMYERLNNSKFVWHRMAVSNDFVRCDQKRLLTLFPTIWNDITKMHLYQKYKPHIDLIYHLVSNKQSWLHKNDLKECWGIINMKPYITEKVTVDVLWNRFNNEGNV